MLLVYFTRHDISNECAMHMLPSDFWIDYFKNDPILAAQAALDSGKPGRLNSKSVSDAFKKSLGETLFRGGTSALAEMLDCLSVYDEHHHETPPFFANPTDLKSYKDLRSATAKIRFRRERTRKRYTLAYASALAPISEQRMIRAHFGIAAALVVGTVLYDPHWTHILAAAFALVKPQVTSPALGKFLIYALSREPRLTDDVNTLANGSIIAAEVAHQLEHCGQPMRIPDVRILRSSVLAKYFFSSLTLVSANKSAIIINQRQSLTASYDSMRALAGFELAHIMKHHPAEKLVFAGLLGAIALAAPSVYFSLLALPAYASLSRFFNFQADRVGAVSSGTPEGLINLYNQKLSPPHRHASVFQSFVQAGVAFALRLAHYAGDFNPTPAQRIKRLRDLTPNDVSEERMMLERPERATRVFIDRALDPLYYLTNS